jgi:hypothetical protein
MNFQELMKKMVELDQPVSEEKKADKDYDGDGKIESEKDEVWGSRMKAAFPKDEEKEKEVDEAFIDECGMDMPSGMMGMRSPEPKQSDSVTMNVSMNGSGAGGIKDLLNVLRNIESAGSDVDDGPGMLIKKDGDDMPPELKSMGKALDDDFANEPAEIYKDMDSMMQPGDDLHSKGAEAPKVNGGGNPRQIKAGETFKLPSGNLKVKLESLYNEIKNR